MTKQKIIRRIRFTRSMRAIGNCDKYRKETFEMQSYDNVVRCNKVTKLLDQAQSRFENLISTTVEI
jgi:hypothetical protein